MKLSDMAVNRPVTILMIVLAVLILGAVSLGNLNIDLFPQFNLPVAAVITSYSGAAPQEVETMITKPLEEVLGTVNNVSSLRSMSMMGSSIVIVEFENGTDMNFAALQMREKVDLVKGMLPGDSGEPMVVKMDPNMLPVLQLGISGDLPLDELKSVAEDTIKPRLERIEGVASVNITGGLTREIQVIVEPDKLQSYGLSINQLIQALQAQNMNLSAGEVTRGDQDLMVRVTGEYHDVAQIAETSIITPAGSQIRLKDVAEVKDGFKDTTSYGRLNGKPSIGLAIQKQTNANTVEVVRQVRKAMEDLKAEIPGEVQVGTILDQAQYIELSIDNVVKNLIMGGILAVIVLFVFLRNIRSTLVIGLAMPISVIATFMMVYFGGLTLNMMSLGGLALGIGMMVDSAIVVLENIFRHREEGLDQFEAAKFGANEVANAIIASTLTTIAVFFPIVFVKGMASELFKELALTVSFSLVASLLVALTLVPMLASRMLKINGKNGGPRGISGKLVDVTGNWLKGIDNVYGRTLQWCLSHRAVTVIVVTLLLAGSIALIPLIGAEFIPAMDQGMITAEINLPNGAQLQDTEKVVARVEQAFSSYREDIDTLYASVGSSTGEMGGLSVGGSENARIDVTLVSSSKRKHSTEEITGTVSKEAALIPGAEIKVSANDATAGMGMFLSPIEVSVRGNDLDELAGLADKIAGIIKKVPGTKDVATSLEEGRPELQVIVDRDKASSYGLTVAQISAAARAAIQGQVATRYRTGSDEIDVRVRYAEDARQNVNNLQNLILASPLGYQVPLRELAEIKQVQGPNTIERRDQARVVTVTANLDGRDLASVMGEVKKNVDADIKLPSGYLIEYGGANQQMTEAFGDLSLALILAIILVYMIMAAQFESLLHPFVIMFSMPVTIIGVVLGLVLTGRTFSVVTFIGVIMLAGIVVNNAIVLVDYINILRRRGMERDEAILKAGPTRLRPILMTALTTILAMVPLALGIGEGAESQAPLATAVIGGLMTSTLLTLLVVPVIYSITDDISRRFTSKKTVKAKAKEKLEG